MPVSAVDQMAPQKLLLDGIVEFLGLGQHPARTVVEAPGSRLIEEHGIGFDFEEEPLSLPEYLIQDLQLKRDRERLT